MSQTKKEKELLALAEIRAQQYIEHFDLTGDYDTTALAVELSKRVHEGEPVVSLCVEDPEDIRDMILLGISLFTEKKPKVKFKRRVVTLALKQLQAATGKKPKHPGIDGCRELFNVVAKNSKNVEKIKATTEAELVQVARDLQPYNCIWDYYLTAFWDSAYQAFEKKEIEFADQSLLEAYKLGLGYMINLGNLLVTITRPEAYRDDQLRLHRENGPATIWGNTKQYWWHGVEVEADWIEHPEKLDPTKALAEPNQEKRRALCEIIGWPKVLDSVGAKTVHTDDKGSLVEVNLEAINDGDPVTRFVRVVCPSTKREYALRVPHTTTTATEGVAWTFDVPTEKYQPTFES